MSHQWYSCPCTVIFTSQTTPALQCYHRQGIKTLTDIQETTYYWHNTLMWSVLPTLTKPPILPPDLRPGINLW